MTEHVRFYLRSLKAFLGSGVPLRVAFIDLTADSTGTKLLGAAQGNLREFDDVDISLEMAQKRETLYYGKLRFHIYASASSGREIELVDGGDTDWTQKLLNNRKERLLISGIGSERLCQGFTPVRRSQPSQPTESDLDG